MQYIEWIAANPNEKRSENDVQYVNKVVADDTIGPEEKLRQLDRMLNIEEDSALVVSAPESMMNDPEVRARFERAKEVEKIKEKRLEAALSKIKEYEKEHKNDRQSIEPE